MTRESLSALMDGECPPAEMDRLLEALEQSPALKQEWSRLCMAREAREGTRLSKDPICICAGVMAGLDEQPEAARVSKVIGLFSRSKPMLWKPLAGFAAAASVAAVALLVSQPGQRQVISPQDSSGFTQQIAAPVSFPLPRRYGNGGLRSVALQPEEAQRQQELLEQREELNNLLMEHNGSMAEQGMGGTLRYARFAAHTADYRTQPVGNGDQP